MPPRFRLSQHPDRSEACTMGDQSYTAGVGDWEIGKLGNWEIEQLPSLGVSQFPNLPIPQCAEFQDSLRWHYDGDSG